LGWHRASAHGSAASLATVEQLDVLGARLYSAALHAGGGGFTGVAETMLRCLV